MIAIISMAGTIDYGKYDTGKSQYQSNMMDDFDGRINLKNKMYI